MAIPVRFTQVLLPILNVSPDLERLSEAIQAQARYLEAQQRMLDAMYHQLATRLNDILQPDTISFNAGGGDNSIPANTTEENTIAFTGAAVEDIVTAQPRTLEAGLVPVSVRVSATDTLAIAVRNTTGSAVATGVQTWSVTIFRP